MATKYRPPTAYVGITDRDWFGQLRHADVDEVNFWQPSPHAFRALSPGEPFLFKIQAPEWKPNIESGRRYRLDEQPGESLWNQILPLIAGQALKAGVVSIAEPI